ncbi:integrase catalytic domain-containing protein [Trichonephila clavipes]|uniref:Integrase catalytic domain-containing protein n=1 Tax=Trichonephila clavipes TaxID=2585209 RepID=A0A8X6UWC0_TRICX|nr:integrase catalytic domain-containing protein [Trichonephila clavipes]
MKQKQQTKNKHSGSARARSDQWTTDIQNRLKSTLEGKINRIETFIESANEETDSVEIKVKLRILIQLQKLLRNNYYAIPNVKDAELTAIFLKSALKGLGIRDDPVLHERDQAIEIFKETVEFEKSRYIVQLPFRKSYNELSDNYPLAKQRFQNLWRRFGHDSELYQQYREIIRDYTEQGIIEEVKTEITDNKLKISVYYLPHQAIRKDGRLTSKTRIVFDAGSHQNNELSLNDCLWPGINLNPNLLDILINFRLNAIAFCSDIKQVFFQICLADEHKDAVRFLWGDDEPCVHKRPKLQLPHLRNLKIPRLVLYSTLLEDDVELHSFCDASKKAYGAAIYLRTKSRNGISVKLVTSKSRVEPLNCVSLPRLELLGALGAARLASKVKKIVNLKRSCLQYHWTDSKIVLFWIKGYKTRWKQFVANRVNEITSLTDPHSWYHCAGKENPADFLSCGLSADCLVSNSRWWTGAEFLSDSEFPKNFQQVVPELDYLTKHEKETVVQERKKFLKLTEVKRLFNYNCRNKSKKVGPLTVAEFKESEIKLIKHTQRSLFDKKEIPSCISNLFPFVDGEGIVRVDGRLENASVPYLHKHPAILPKGSKLSKLYFNSLHTRLFHVGPQGLLNAVRQKFWPLRGRSIARKTVHQCVTCFKSRPILSSQILWDIHLELLSDLTSDALIATLKRFTSRRGKCSKIYTDNATNFVGANSILKKFHKLINFPNENLAKYFVSENIDWKFIPPKSPHFGGLWEAGVKSVKHHLKRAIGNLHFTFEEFETIMIQVEGILNSRPLTLLSSDADNFDVLNPGHFLIGRPITSIPEPNLIDVNENRLS